VLHTVRLLYLYLCRHRSLPKTPASSKLRIAPADKVCVIPTQSAAASTGTMVSRCNAARATALQKRSVR
jgi:hypothetical protein